MQSSCRCPARQHILSHTCEELLYGYELVRLVCCHEGPPRLSYVIPNGLHHLQGVSKRGSLNAEDV